MTFFARTISRQVGPAYQKKRNAGLSDRPILRVESGEEVALSLLPRLDTSIKLSTRTTAIGGHLSGCYYHHYTIYHINCPSSNCSSVTSDVDEGCPAESAAHQSRSKGTISRAKTALAGPLEVKWRSFGRVMKSNKLCNKVLAGADISRARACRIAMSSADRLDDVPTAEKMGATFPQIGNLRGHDLHGSPLW